MVHRSVSRPLMSPTELAKYECADAGGVAIAFNVCRAAPPNPTAMTVADVVSWTSMPARIASRSPPRYDNCTPSVNKTITCCVPGRASCRAVLACRSPREMAVPPLG